MLYADHDDLESLEPRLLNMTTIIANEITAESNRENTISIVNAVWMAQYVILCISTLTSVLQHRTNLYISNQLFRYVKAANRIVSETIFNSISPAGSRNQD